MQLLSTIPSLLLLSLIQFTVARSYNAGLKTITETETETITVSQVCKPCKPYKPSTTTLTIRAPLPPPRTTTVTETVDFNPDTFQSFADRWSITCSGKPRPTLVTKPTPVTKSTPVKLICPPSVTSTVTAVDCPKIRCGAKLVCPVYDAPPDRQWDCRCTSRPPTTSTQTIECKGCCGPAPTEGWVDEQYCMTQESVKPIKTAIPAPVEPEKPVRPTKKPIPTPVEPEVEVDPPEEPEPKVDAQKTLEEEESKEEEPEED